MERRQRAQDKAVNAPARNPSTQKPGSEPGLRFEPEVGPPRVLIVGRRRGECEGVAARLAPWRCEIADTADAARIALVREWFDAAMIDADLPAGAGLKLARDVVGADAGVAVVVLAENPSVDLAMEAMRLGAADIVSPRLAGAECQGRVRRAIDRSSKARDREARIERLRKVCKRLNDARHEVTRQVGALCNDLVEAYQELTDRVANVSFASEFNSLIRQELDIESLLRTALEFVLAKVGPTNAAVFLPSTSSDFSLGAYVNYDCPKDTADVLLDHLAGVVPARMEGRDGIVACPGARELETLLGKDAHWLADSGAVAFNCRHAGETLAVVILFRDCATPFPPALLPTLRIIADLFGQQLARVIRVHHRHLPKEQWGGFAEPDDDADLAA